MRVKHFCRHCDGELKATKEIKEDHRGYYVAYQVENCENCQAELSGASGTWNELDKESNE